MEPCDKACAGSDPNDRGCGGLYMASTYENLNFIVPTMVPSVGLWNALGCYTSAILPLITVVW